GVWNPVGWASRDVLVARHDKTNQLGVFDGASAELVGLLDVPAFKNVDVFLARDLVPALATVDVGTVAALLDSFRLEDESVAMTADLAFFAHGRSHLEVIRLRDGRRLRLEAMRFGTLLRLAVDDRGDFDGDAATLARVRCRGCNALLAKHRH